jgi:hypothetical protein
MAEPPASPPPQAEPAEPAAPAAARPGCGPRLSIAVAMLLGIGYVAWIAWAEGPRVWVVLGLILLVALCATIAHRLMAMTRR